MSMSIVRPLLPFLTRSAPAAGLACALLAAGLPACKREEVTHAKAAKSPEPAMPRGPMQGTPQGMPGQGMPGQPPPGMAGDVPPPPAPDKPMKWTLPKGWTETLVGGMRYATLTAPVKGKVDVSIVVLPGPAGGELANVNRWRGQLGLAPIDEPQLASGRTGVKSKAGPISLFDFTGEGEKKSRMLAGLGMFNGSSWFVKMVGDEGSVAAAKADFVHLLESLHFDAP